MSVWIEDKNGFVGDLASNSGLSELSRRAGPKLGKLLATGKAETEDELSAIIAEVKGTAAAYVGTLLASAEAPVVVTDGVIDEDEE